MTMQATNPIWIDGKEWKLIGVEKWKSLFEPKSYGLRPLWIDTACWCGYVITLCVEGKLLYLEELDVHTSDNIYPDINGVHPVPDNHGYHHYDDIHKHVAYTGKIAIAEGFNRAVGITIFPKDLINIRVLNFIDGELIDIQPFSSENESWQSVFD